MLDWLKKICPFCKDKDEKKDNSNEATEAPSVVEESSSDEEMKQ